MPALWLLLAAFCQAAPRQINQPPPIQAQASVPRLAPALPAAAAPPAAAPAAKSAQEPAAAALYSIRGEDHQPPQPTVLDAAFDGGSLRERAQHAALPWRTERQLARVVSQPRGRGERFSFNVVGDGEEGRFWFSRALFNTPGVFARQLAAADREPADFTVQLGDMVSRGTPRRFLKFFQMLRYLKLKLPLLTIPGNHDRQRPHGLSNNRLYKALFGAADYHMDRGDWRFIFLDSSARQLTAVQLRWADALLETPLRKVIFTHVPPGPLSAWTDWGPFKGVGGIAAGGAELAAIAARRGVEAVFVGHIHALDARDHQGVRYYLTGGGGSPLYPAAPGNNIHHYLHVQAGPDGLNVSVRAHEL